MSVFDNPDGCVLAGGMDIAVYVTVFETLLPVTEIEPDEGDTEYPETGDTVYEKVPFGTVNVIVSDADISVVPLKVTDHDVPKGRPVSLKVIAYLLTVDRTFSVKDVELAP